MIAFQTPMTMRRKVSFFFHRMTMTATRAAIAATTSPIGLAVRAALRSHCAAAAALVATECATVAAVAATFAAVSATHAAAWRATLAIASAACLTNDGERPW